MVGSDGRGYFAYLFSPIFPSIHRWVGGYFLLISFHLFYYIYYLFIIYIIIRNFVESFLRKILFSFLFLLFIFIFFLSLSNYLDTPLSLNTPFRGWGGTKQHITLPWSLHTSLSLILHTFFTRGGGLSLVYSREIQLEIVCDIVCDILTSFFNFY